MQGAKQMLVDISVVLAIPVLVVLAYFYIWKTDGSDGAIAPSTPGNELLARGAKVKEALNIIRKVHFDGSIFKDPMFDQMEDQTVTVVDEAVGRDNPFILPDSLKGKVHMDGKVSTAVVSNTQTKPLTAAERLEQTKKTLTK
jgi:hypothetical protein